MICSEDNPLGAKCTHYFWRREYQQRGMVHFHLIVWTEGAPLLGNSKNSEIVDFITKVAKCSMPKKEDAPILHEKVSKYQKHKHNAYRERNKKQKTD